MLLKNIKSAKKKRLKENKKDFSVFLFICLFPADTQWLSVLVCLQCFPPARHWTSTVTTANASVAPGCVTETTTARTTPTSRTAVSDLLLIPLSFSLSLCCTNQGKWPHHWSSSERHTHTHRNENFPNQLCQTLRDELQRWTDVRQGKAMR